MGISLKMCEVMQYREYLEYDISQIADILESKGNVRDYAIVLHDKDIEVKPHYHIAIRFKNSQDISYVAKWFGIGENYVGKVKGKWVDICKYLTHDNAPDKYQYSVEEVVCNFDIVEEKNKKTDKEVLLEVEEKILTREIKRVNMYEKIDPRIFAKNERYILSLIKVIEEKRKMDKNRSIQVIFIQGGSGTGKTTYAKGWCEDNNLSYCVSSSNNDPLQDYVGEDVLILDDLREDAFSFNEILKLLDNHTSSSVKSRYNNKWFDGDFIIITSTVELADWYSMETIEDRHQLRRRISSMIKIAEKGKQLDIFSYNEQQRKYEYCGTGKNPYYQTKQDIMGKKEMVMSMFCTEVISINKD